MENIPYKIVTKLDVIPLPETNNKNISHTKLIIGESFL